MQPFTHKEITSEFAKKLACQFPDLLHEITEDMKAYALDYHEEEYEDCVNLINRISKCYELQISNII